MKKSKTAYSSNIKMVAVFVAGLAVATLGWYYSDRLNVAFGRTADIDVIGTTNNHVTPPAANCTPGDKTHVVRHLEGCELITRTTSCLPVHKYINYIKTRSGMHAYETMTPRRRSHPITKYETAVREERHSIKDELADASREVAEYKHGKSMSMLSQDKYFQELVASHTEIKNLHGKLGGMVCPPGILN